MGRTHEALRKAEEERRGRIGQGVPYELPLPARPSGAAEVDGLVMTSQAMVEYHKLKYNILRLNSQRRLKALLFCSPTEGEGASTSLVYFAITLASDGNRVLVVDANLRSPSLDVAFGVEREHGLTDLLLERSPMNQVLKVTGYRSLSVITSGMFYRNPDVVLESDSFEKYREEMVKRADWVLFDCSAINSSNDAILLAPRVDGVIMVLESERTRWEVAENARQRIKAANGNILGVLLNKRKYYIPNWLYKRL
jgi:protein-tyrosine kinase